LESKVRHGQIGRLFTLGSFFIAKVAQIFGKLFPLFPSDNDGDA
jgi:hypothetical protein